MILDTDPAAIEPLEKFLSLLFPSEYLEDTFSSQAGIYD